MQIAETPFITRFQLEAKFAQVKNLKSMSTQSKPPLGNKPIRVRLRPGSLIPRGIDDAVCPA